MPGKKTYKKTYRKKRKYNKKRKNNIFRPQRLLKVGFPKTTVVKLRYCEYINLDPGVATIAKHVFGANDCFDPNATGVGHQPYGFDQWSQLYNHYTVIGSRITAQFSNTSGSTIGLNYCGINLSDDATTTSSIDHMLEQGLTKYKMIAGNSGQSNAMKTVSCNYSAKKFFNITNISDNQDRLGTVTSASPGERANFVVWIGSANPAIDQADFEVMVKIDFIVMFGEPKELPQS